MRDEHLGITHRFEGAEQAQPKPGARVAGAHPLRGRLGSRLRIAAVRIAHGAFRPYRHPGRGRAGHAPRQALIGDKWDLVISDHSLPRFSSVAAVQVLREQHPDIPFIIASGAIGEDAAVAALQSGADDYLLKHSMKRLVPAIENALAAGRARRERRAATEDLRSGLDYLRALLRASPVGIMALDGDHNITLLNAAAERIFGIRREDALGAPPPIAAPDNQRILDRLLKAVKQGPVERVEETWYRTDGSACDLSFSAARLQGGADVVFFVADLTEQKRAELAQRETETRFAAISANLPGVVFQMLARPAEEQLLMPYVSPGAISLFGVDAGSLPRPSPALFIGLLDPADRADLRDAVTQALRHRLPLEGQWRISRAGATRWIQVAATAREVGGGNWLLDGIITDITAHKEAEQDD